MKSVKLIFSKNVPGVPDQTVTLGLNVGSEGKSAYEVAVSNGFEGSEKEWVDSLQGPQGQSAYETYRAAGGTRTEEEFNISLIKIATAASTEALNEEVSRAQDAEAALSVQIGAKVSVQGGETGETVTTFAEAGDRTNILSGEKQATLFGKIKRWFSDLKTVAFSGAYSDLSGTPISLPANGGSAESALKDGAGNVIADSYLSKTNQQEYTPSSDYNPATKKYVDNIQLSSTNLLSNSERIYGSVNSYYKSLYTNIPASYNDYFSLSFTNAGDTPIRMFISQRNSTGQSVRDVLSPVAAPQGTAKYTVLLDQSQVVSISIGVWEADNDTSVASIEYDLKNVILVKGQYPALTWSPQPVNSVQIPVAVIDLTNGTTSKNISNAIGGESGFMTVYDAIVNKQNIRITGESSGCAYLQYPMFSYAIKENAKYSLCICTMRKDVDTPNQKMITLSYDETSGEFECQSLGSVITWA